MSLPSTIEFYHLKTIEYQYVGKAMDYTSPIFRFYVFGNLSKNNYTFNNMLVNSF